MTPDHAAEYAEAYKAIHGAYPVIHCNGGRYDVTTRTGRHSGYTPHDLANLTRILRRMAKQEAA